MFQLLKEPRYLRFWLGQVISLLGDGITRVAIVYLVATLSKDPLAIGLVIIAQLLPSAVFGIFLGPLADKYNRRWLMVGADFYRMIVVLLMIPFHDSVPLLITLIIFQGLGSAIFDPARSSSIPDLVGESKIGEAISLSQSTRAAMDIAGPSLGALLMISSNYSLIFTIDALTFALSALFLCTLTSLGKVPQQKDSKPEAYLSSISSGLKEVTGMPALRFLLLLLMPIIFVCGVLNTNLIAVLTNVFHVSAFHFGFIEASLAVGMIIGAAFFAPFFMKKWLPGTVLLTGTASIGIWMVLIVPLNILRMEIGISPVYIWCIMVGVLNAFINVPIGTLFLSSTPAPFRGRGSSLLNFVASVFQILGVFLGGWIAKEIGVLYGTALAGSLLIFVTLLLPYFKGFKDLSRKENKMKVTPPIAAN